MSTWPEEDVLAAKIRDDCLRWLEIHSRHCASHDCIEPAGLLAYLAHCLGISEARLKHLPRLIVMYDMRCPGCGSQRDAAAREGAREGTLNPEP